MAPEMYGEAEVLNTDTLGLSLIESVYTTVDTGLSRDHGLGLDISMIHYPATVYYPKDVCEQAIFLDVSS